MDKIPENLSKTSENPRKIPENLGKIPENLGKNGAHPCLTSKMAPNGCRKTHYTFFWRSHQKWSS